MVTIVTMNKFFSPLSFVAVFGSGTLRDKLPGSATLRRIRMFLGLMDPDPSVIKQRKTLIPTVL
jgi:hypothetical protein